MSYIVPTFFTEGGLEEVVAEVHQLIHDAVVSCLQKVALVPEIVEYQKKHRCILRLEAGDVDGDIIDKDLALINGDSVFELIKLWDESKS